MIITYKEVLKKYKNNYQLKKALEKEEIFKVARGLYSKKPYIDEQKEVFLKYDYAVLTLQSAFYYHGVSDYFPEYIYVATPRNSHHLTNDSIKQIFMSNKYINIGVSHIKKDGYILKVFDFERTLIELIRYEKKIPYEEYIHVLREFRKISHKLDVRKLIKYANQFNYKKKILRVVESSIL